jgi:hypothetical protein
MLTPIRVAEALEAIRKALRDADDEFERSQMPGGNAMTGSSAGLHHRRTLRSRTKPQPILESVKWSTISKEASMKKNRSLAGTRVSLAAGRLFGEALLTVGDELLSVVSGSEATTSTNDVLHGRWDGSYKDGT